MSEASLQLQVQDAGGERLVSLIEPSTAMGRDSSCGLQLQGAGVSRRHGRFDCPGSGWYYTDAGSQNGSLLNGERLQPETPYLIHTGDVIKLVSATLRVVAAETVSEAAPSPDEAWQDPVSDETLVAPQQREPDNIEAVASVGRAIDNDIVVSDPYVSGHHIEAWLRGGQLYVRDLSSRNGTFLGEIRFTEGLVAQDATLRLGAELRLPAADLLGCLRSDRRPPVQPPEQAGRAHLLVGRELGRRVGSKIVLRDVDVSVHAGQFVAVAGASGAGKSTLMKVLNGYTPPHMGRLLVASDGARPGAIGYVPQDDILNRELQLRDALVLSARLRYPPGTEMAAVRKRADEVMADLGLAESAGTTVGHLSGGQRKRASVALELMMRPRLLLLDEPTSGLDPATDRRLVRLLRALADSGIGIVLITHTTTNITACDTVAFLATGGYLVFWGRPETAQHYFGTGNLEEVYEQLETAATPEQWRQRFVASPEYQQLRSDELAGFNQLEATQRGVMAPERPNDAATLVWQLVGLTRRYARTVLADKRNLALLLVQIPVILVLARIIFAMDVLRRVNRNLSPPVLRSLAESGGEHLPEFGNATPGMNLLFVVATTLVWLGTINAAREICKELPIWEREHHVGVRTVPYVLSKLFVLGSLCAVQTALFVVLMLIFWDVPGGTGAVTGILLTGLLASLSGVAVGLSISASVATPDRAVALVPIIMIPQILFGGTVIPLSSMGSAAKALSWFVGARWTFEALSRLTNRSIYLPPGSPFEDSVTGSPSVPLAALVGLVLLFSLLALLLVAIRAAGNVRSLFRRRRSAGDA